MRCSERRTTVCEPFLFRCFPWNEHISLSFPDCGENKHRQNPLHEAKHFQITASCMLTNCLFRAFSAWMQKNTTSYTHIHTHVPKKRCAVHQLITGKPPCHLQIGNRLKPSIHGTFPPAADTTHACHILPAIIQSLDICNPNSRAMAPVSKSWIRADTSQCSKNQGGGEKVTHSNTKMQQVEEVTWMNRVAPNFVKGMTLTTPCRNTWRLYESLWLQLNRSSRA